MSDPRSELSWLRDLIPPPDPEVRQRVTAKLATLVEAGPSSGTVFCLETRPRRWIGQWSHRLVVVAVAAAIIVVFFVPLPHVSLFKRLVAPPKVTPSGATVPKLPQIQVGPSQVAPLAMTFVDTAHGFVLSQGCTKTVCEAWVDATTDGGDRWQPEAAFVAYPAADNVKTALPDNPVPNPDRLGADRLVFVSANDGWAYGPGLFVTHDGGREFRRLNVSAPVLSVEASEGHVWVLEQKCLPADRNNDGGWSSKCDRSVLLSGPLDGDGLSPVAGPIPGFSLASGSMEGSQFPTEIVHTSASLAVLAGSYGLDVTESGGRTWRRASYPCKAMSRANVVLGGLVGSVATDPTGSIWLLCAGEPGAGQQPKQLWRSFDNAKTWLGPYQLSWAGYADTVYPVSSTVAWNYGSRAPVLRSTDGGHSWKALLESVFNDAEGGPAAFSAIGTQDAWAIPSDQVPTEVLRTTNGGRSWQSTKVPTFATSPFEACPATGVFAPGELFGVQFLSVATGWTVGSDGIMTTDDGGVHWKVQYRARCADLSQIDFLDAEHGWAVGLTDLLTTTDGGRHWQELKEPARPIRSVHFVSSRVGYAVAGGGISGNWSPMMTPWTGGVVLKTLDGGQSWTLLAAPADAQSVCFSTPEEGLLGADGRVYRSFDGGRSWSLVLKGYGQGEDRPLAMVQCVGQIAGWAELDGPGGEMSQSPHIAFHSDGGAWTPIFAEQYFPHPGIDVSVNSPGSYSGPFSAIDPDTAVFIDTCAACAPAGTAPWAIAERGGKELVRPSKVGYITSAIGVSFVTSSSGWVTGIYWDGSSTVYRLVHTNNAGRTWTIEYTS